MVPITNRSLGTLTAAVLLALTSTAGEARAAQCLDGIHKGHNHRGAANFAVTEKRLAALRKSHATAKGCMQWARDAAKKGDPEGAQQANACVRNAASHAERLYADAVSVLGAAEIHSGRSEQGRLGNARTLVDQMRDQMFEANRLATAAAGLRSEEFAANASAARMAVLLEEHRQSFTKEAGNLKSALRNLIQATRRWEDVGKADRNKVLRIVLRFWRPFKRAYGVMSKVRTLQSAALDAKNEASKRRFVALLRQDTTPESIKGILVDSAAGQAATFEGNLDELGVPALAKPFKDVKSIFAREARMGERYLIATAKVVRAQYRPLIEGKVTKTFNALIARAKKHLASVITAVKTILLRLAGEGE